MVTTRSTRVPGTTNPATPTTSFTLTAIARMPDGMDGGRPAPAPTGASLLSVTGSFCANGAIRPRFTTTLTSAAVPGTCARPGQGTTLTSSGVSIVPMGSGRAA